MYEHLKKRDQVRDITREVLQTFGTLQPKLEHLAPTPVPDKSSIIQIVDDLLEVIYPGYFGRKYVESSNIEYHIGDLIDSIFGKVVAQIAYPGYRSFVGQGGACISWLSFHPSAGIVLLEGNSPGIDLRVALIAQRKSAVLFQSLAKRHTRFGFLERRYIGRRI